MIFFDTTFKMAMRPQTNGAQENYHLQETMENFVFPDEIEFNT